MRTLDMRNICFQTNRNNRIRQKVVHVLRKIQTLRVNNSINLKTQNAKFSGYYFYMKTSIWRDFQIYISVPLSSNPANISCFPRRLQDVFSTSWPRRMFDGKSLYICQNLKVNVSKSVNAIHTENNSNGGPRNEKWKPLVS